MSQFYSNPDRASDPFALPDSDTFFIRPRNFAPYGCPLCPDGMGPEDEAEHKASHVGWYWQACFPGCMPDGEPEGPFKTEALAIADCRRESAE